ncbi:MAG TPA: glycosyltransferase family 39 protein [Acidimicrobiales bacterium]|nr:glycosyltransferase family 39 protein [Acidimicrobiales bacterium]
MAAIAYSWGIGNQPMEPFYAAAARSMGTNWKDFFFGAVDPAGTVSLDKLPGAIWLQALSVRAFGFHYWAVALPQVIAGVLTVLVLYRAVRRLAGPKAGLLAAVSLAASPATALVNRGNVSDSLLVLLTVLAADATSRALTTGRLRTLVLAGCWVGLAFQTKMMQAWLVLPALFLAYMVAAPPNLRRRLGHVALAGLFAAAISLSWMSLVTAVPAHDRPYVDGTTDDSVYTQVFVYNGSTRLGIRDGDGTVVHGGQPFLDAIREATPDVGMFRIAASPTRLLAGPLGRDDGWLLPAALVAGIGVLVARRRAPRQDRARAAVILWGTWLVVLTGLFSFGTFINSYYTAALVPAVAALCATGLAVGWRSRSTSSALRGLFLVLVPLSAAYAIWLIPPGSGVHWWLVPMTVFAAVAAETVLTLGSHRSSPTILAVGVSLGVASILLVSAITTGVVVGDGLGSFSTPYQSAAATAGTTIGPERFQAHGGAYAAYIDRYFPGISILAAYDTAALASPFIMITGREYLPIGGYGGNNPSPTMARLQHLVAAGQLHELVIPVRPAGSDPRLAWVRAHCEVRRTVPYVARVELRYYWCSPGLEPPRPPDTGGVGRSLEKALTEAKSSTTPHVTTVEP